MYNSVKKLNYIALQIVNVLNWGTPPSPTVAFCVKYLDPTLPLY